jgi:hypothetical protein
MLTERVDLIHKPDNLKSLTDHLPEAGRLRNSYLTDENVKTIKNDLTGDFEAVATDLKTNNLAKNHVESLVTKLINDGAKTEYDLLVGGSREFYNVAENVLGPLWSAYVDEVLKSGKGDEIYLFAARDATPMYHAAEGLLSKPNGYKLDGSGTVHVDWNRWFMGQEDETDSDKKSLPLTHPHMKAFYEQMGFGNGKLIKIVEPGAWGSAANALKTRMPEQPFELWFMFSHMPDKIYGFLNSHAKDVDPKVFEMINDSAEAVPKSYIRPETFVEQGGLIKPDISEKVVSSPYMQVWTKATLVGAYAAGIDYSLGKRVNIKEHVEYLQNLSNKAKQGEWTGILPDHSLTWTEGENWRKNWKWGKIPPLK